MVTIFHKELRGVYMAAKRVCNHWYEFGPESEFNAAIDDLQTQLDLVAQLVYEEPPDQE